MLVLSTLFGIALIAIAIKFLTWKKLKLPPGPAGLPFFGNFFQIERKHPHATLTKWSDCHGDVFKYKLFGRHTVVLNSFETIYEGLVTKANDFAGRDDSFRLKVLRNFANDIGFSTYSPKWASMKKLTMQTLKMYGDTLENLEVITLDLIDDLLEQLQESSKKGPVDMFPIVHKCTNGVITSIVYGKKVDDAKVKELLEITDETNAAVAPTQGSVILDIVPWLWYIPNSFTNKLAKMRDRNVKWFTSEIKERRAKYEPGSPKCLMDGLFDQQQKLNESDAEYKLSDSDIYGINVNMIFAGTNTTSSTIYCLFAILVNKPEIQKKMTDQILEEIGSREPRLSDRKTLVYIEAALLEVLRYSSIVPLNLPHCTTVDTTINGFDIPKDTQVLFNLWKLHHNPEYWDEPWEFRPERFLDDDGTVVKPDHINRKRLMSFGASRRVCVGENLAKNRLFLMVTSLLQHFEFLPADPDQPPKHDPREYGSGFLLRPQQYFVKLVPRQ